jgi:cysteine-rich repeat protein
VVGGCSDSAGPCDDRVCRDSCRRAGWAAGLCRDGACQCSETGFGCGDGFVDEGEECDDGNTAGGDGCSATCRLETGRDADADVGDDAGRADEARVDVDGGPDADVPDVPDVRPEVSTDAEAGDDVGPEIGDDGRRDDRGPEFDPRDDGGGETNTEGGPPCDPMTCAMTCGGEGHCEGPTCVCGSGDGGGGRG